MPSEAYIEYLCTREVLTDEEVGFGVRDCAAPEAEATPPPTPTPAAPPSLGPRPSGPAGPLAWTPASLKEDWPAPVRPEPAGGAIVVPLQEEADEVIPDPVGDTGSAAHPWVDIRELQGGGARIIIDLASNLPPHVAPAERWIAYGVVVDDDRDGIPDRRFGIDNIPGTEPGDGGHREWITDLHTGRTLGGITPDERLARPGSRPTSRRPVGRRPARCSDSAEAYRVGAATPGWSTPSTCGPQ